MSAGLNCFWPFAALLERVHGWRFLKVCFHVLMTDLTSTLKTPSEARGSLAPLILAYGLLVAGLGVFLGPALIGRERLAFRDVSHFYTPLYEYVDARQSETWLPLWNPMDLTGLPLAGETTTAVFYPLRILVYRLIPSPVTAIAWYVALHLILAAIAIHVAAKSAGAGRLGCSLAVLAYPLAGPVFFLIYNPPFLVGAAWMPIALAGGLQLLQRTSLRWIAITAFSLAMPVLGGDPQTTVHGLMLGTITMMVRVATSIGRGGERPFYPVIGLSAAAILGGCIAAPQLAASIDWGMQSGRLAGYSAAERYDFNVLPWRWMELVIPEASGRLFPTNTRLSQAIPGDGRAWVVTLSAGILSLVLAMDRYLRRGWDFWDWLLPIGLLFSMAGPYWLLVTAVPGYEAFRYPSKWLPIAVIGMVVMAARQMEHLQREDNRSIHWLCLGIGAFAIVGAASSVFVASMGLTETIESLPITDRFWGRLQLEVALTNFAWSALFTAIVVMVFGLLSRSSIRHRKWPWFGVAIVLLASLDLFSSVRTQIATVDVQTEKEILAAVVDVQPREESDARSMHISEGPSWPEEWRLHHDGEDRILEVEVSQRATQFGRWHLWERNATFNSMVSIRPQRIDAFWNAMKDRHFSGGSTERKDTWLRLESWLGVQNQHSSQIETVPGPKGRELSLAIGKESPNPNPTSLFRWDNQWQSIAPIRIVSADEMRSRIAEIIDDQTVSNPRVEGGNQAKKAIPTSVPAIQAVLLDPDRMVFEIDSEHAGLLTVKTFQDGNWQASLANLDQGSVCPATVKRTDYLFMGVEVPKGKWQVTIWYRPWWLTPSLLLAAAGMGLAVLGAMLRARDKMAVV